MKESFYFSHDYNARNDQKILTLRGEFGLEGYALYFMILESMAEETSGYLNRGAIGGLSVSYGIAKSRLTEFIDMCVDIGLFIEDSEGIFSKRMLEHKNLRKTLSNNGKAGADKKWQTVREKKEQFKEMASFFNHTCVRCEGRSGLKNVERDHIIPTYQGGIDDITNWQPLCAKCNSSKGPETIDHRIIYAEKHSLAIPKEWLGYSGAIAKERKGKENKEKKNNTYTESFEIFWKEYPNRVGKPDALKKYKEQEHADIMDGLTRWKEYWDYSETEQRFIPHPATWLNQERYKDEPPETKPKTISVINKF